MAKCSTKTGSAAAFISKPEKMKYVTSLDVTILITKWWHIFCCWTPPTNQTKDTNSISMIANNGSLQEILDIIYMN